MTNKLFTGWMAVSAMALVWNLSSGASAQPPSASGQAQVLAKGRSSNARHRRFHTATPDACDDHEQPGEPVDPGLTPLPGETCYEFQVHNGQTLSDKTPYVVPAGEHYEQFYYAAPWPTGTVATRYGAKYDNRAVVHHWFMHSTTEFDAPGTHHEAPLPTLLGTAARRIAGAAVGAGPVVLPDDVGLELPANGATLDIQWDYRNTSDASATDLSSVQICTVPGTQRQHIASMTLVGTEDLGGNKWFGGVGMPPHQASEFQATCNPLRAGLNATDAIQIVGFQPYMHSLGTNMKTIINRSGGESTTVLDEPYDFDQPMFYPQRQELRPGDTLSVVCSFFNPNDNGVAWGDTSDDEMCYNFVTSYPARALDNAALSLLGSENTCW